MKQYKKLAIGLIILSILGGCTKMTQQNSGAPIEGLSSAPATERLTDVPPIESLIGDSPYLAINYTEFQNTALPPEERYERTADGKIMVKSEWGLYDPGFHFKEYMEGRDPHDGRPYYEEFILDHLNRKYDEEFTLGLRGHPMKTTSGGLYVIRSDGKEMKARYAVRFTEDGKVEMKSTDIYICDLITSTQGDTVKNMVREGLARYAPEIQEPRIGFGAYDSLLPTVFGAGATFQDVNEYCLKYLGYGCDTIVSISYDFGFTSEKEEELTELAFSLVKMLEENNYNGQFTMQNFAPEDWAQIAAGTEFPVGTWPLNTKEISINFGHYPEYPNSHYSQKTIGWED